jgi:hypothetical protein
MSMQHETMHAGGQMQMQAGDPAKMPNMRPFTCCCGTPMEKEERGG